ncbi:MAG: hypothetical protein IKH50_12620 [Oscillospiraceae bacterium]|nr:hypothetical protein [Oscillospiraceae bacterium]
MLTEKDILKGIRDSFEASGDHLSDDFLSDANLEKARRNSAPVYEEKERNYRPLYYSLASAAAVFSLLVAFQFYNLGKQLEHQIEYPVVTTEDNYTGTTRDEFAIENYTNSSAVSEPYVLTNDTSVNETSEISQMITAVHTGTNRIETENNVTQNNANAGQSESEKTDHPVTSSHSYITENEMTKQVTRPLSTEYVTGPEYTTRPVTMPETTTEATTRGIPVTEPATLPWWYYETTPATTRGNPVTEPFTLPWWYYETTPATTECTTVTDDSPYVTWWATMEECTTPPDEVLETTSEHPVTTGEPEVTTAAVTIPPAETEAPVIEVILKSEWDDESENFAFSYEGELYIVDDYPDKYLVKIGDSGPVPLVDVLTNGSVPVDELIAKGVPIKKR